MSGYVRSWRGATKSIVNKQAAGGFSGGITPVDVSAQSAASGAMTAATLKTALSVSGTPGSMDLFAVASVDSTSRTHRIKITVDGVVIFDATSAAYMNGGQLFAAVGNLDAVAKLLPASQGNSVVWQWQLLVEIASSLTEANMTTVYYRYKTEG